MPPEDADFLDYGYMFSDKETIAMIRRYVTEQSAKQALSAPNTPSTSGDPL